MTILIQITGWWCLVNAMVWTALATVLAIGGQKIDQKTHIAVALYILAAMACLK